MQRTSLIALSRAYTRISTSIPRSTDITPRQVEREEALYQRVLRYRPRSVAELQTKLGVVLDHHEGGYVPVLALRQIASDISALLAVSARGRSGCTRAARG